MSAPNSPHHHRVVENRDPIMEDNEFSLRFGNPIKVIHDAQKQKIDTFEPTKNHLSGALANTICETALHENHKPAPNTNASIRDTTICSEFYHTKQGTVTEIEHKKED